MSTNTSAQHLFKGAKLALFQLTMIMIGFSLFVDSVNGFFLEGLGIDPKLSAMYKLLMLIMILFQIASYSQRTFTYLLTLITTLMIGPALNLIESHDGVGLLEDFIALIKLLTPLVVFIYISLVASIDNQRVIKYGIRALQAAFLILLGNLVLGTMGFGYASYSTGDVGVKGFFYAGNEVSGLFIVLFAWFLHQAWQKNSITKYAIASGLTMLFGLLIATKAAMLASALMVYCIPLMNDRNRLLNLTWVKVKLILPLVVLIVLLSLFIVPVLESTGIWGRMVWFYEKKGILGLLFSGRDEFVVDGFTAFYYQAGFLQYIFGFGQSGLGEITKASMEIDPLDMFLWFGAIGLIIYSLLSVLFLRNAYLATRGGSTGLAPAVLLMNILLIGVSVVAGHIFTSGMLGPFVGLINGLVYAELLVQKAKQDQQNDLLKDR